MEEDIYIEELMASIPEDLDSISINRCVFNFSESLEFLPSELIAMIAEYLPKEDILRLRSLGNRNLTRATDHSFAKACFSRRRCRTTTASVARLEALSRTRFAKHIRALEVSILFHCQSPRFGGLRLRKPCLAAAPNTQELATTFGGILQHLPNLRHFVLRAPPALSGMSDATLTDELPQLGASEMQPNLRFHPPHIFALFGPEHHHVIDTRSMTTLGYILVSSFENARQRLDSFQVLGFTDSNWQSTLTSSPALFHSMIKLPALRNLTFLKLELDMMAFENEAMTSLVKMIKGNAILKALHLTAGPKGSQRWSSRTEDWAPLLLLLGSSPPFRLRSLELDGLVTSLTAPTLARIVNVHSSSMRRVVLKHTNFHHPNTLREFFTACANSSIRYYMSENFLFHETRMLVGASLTFSTIRDEMHCDVECENIEQPCCCDMFDTTCLDWVEVRFPTGGGRLLYDDADGRYGDGWMYKAFMGGVAMVKDGAIIDF